MEAVLVFGLIFLARGYRHPVHDLTLGIRPYILLTALCLALSLPGISTVPPTDRDEARFMQATKQMLETGDLVNIRFQDEPRTKKPVGIHWLQYASVKLLSEEQLNTAWMYRVPSVISYWLAVICVFLLGCKLFNGAHGRRAGLIAASLTACTLLTIVEAHLAKTDATLLLTVVLAHMGLAQFYLATPVCRPRISAFFLLWGGIGGGVLIKGPVIVAIVLATALALSAADKNFRWLRITRPLIGLLFAIAFILPWTIAASMSGDGNVILTSLAEDFFPKLISPSEGHGAFPGTHLLLSPITLWPASLIILPGLVLAWQQRHTPAIRFALAWAGATWLMFELVPTKLPHYILPIVPALALATAGAISNSTAKAARWGAVLWTIVTVLLVGGTLWASATYTGSITITVVFAACLLSILYVLWSHKADKLLLVPVTAIVSSAMLLGGILPNLTDLALSPRLATVIAQHRHSSQTPVVLTQFQEPSAVFLLGTNTIITRVDSAADQLTNMPDALAVISNSQRDLMTEALFANQRELVPLDSIAGYNYSKGRSETLLIIRSTGLAVP